MGPSGSGVELGWTRFSQLQHRPHDLLEGNTQREKGVITYKFHFFVEFHLWVYVSVTLHMYDYSNKIVQDYPQNFHLK